MHLKYPTQGLVKQLQHEQAVEIRQKQEAARAAKEAMREAQEEKQGAAGGGSASWKDGESSGGAWKSAPSGGDWRSSAPTAA
jgi:type II secretory pathway pseudopilin PulG